jgi:NAD(P)-dependent dehydrogenase (short-subunit alcohol dehydrogenase family)
MESNKVIHIYEGATAIVTGAASGIGRALSEELARRGCEVVLADLQIGLAEEVASGIRISGGKATAIEVDVRNFPAVDQLVQETTKRTGRLDYLFNNAGIAIIGDIKFYRIEDWNQIVDTNLRGVINGIQAAYKIMMEQGFGHIVNTASISGLIPSPATVAYTTVKHGVVGLSKSLRAQTADKGVRVSVLCPGVIRTPLLVGGKYGKVLINIPPERLLRMWEKTKPMSPDLFAKKALNLVGKNKAIIVIPWWWKSFWWITRLSPSLGIIFARNRSQVMRKQLGVDQKSS